MLIHHPLSSAFIISVGEYSLTSLRTAKTSCSLYQVMHPEMDCAAAAALPFPFVLPSSSPSCSLLIGAQKP